MKKILIKPHHFLDILKLYGSGIETFVPDKNYGHDFYKIGNLLLAEKQSILVLTKGPDDICKPCRFLVKGICRDELKKSIYSEKEVLNNNLDTRILEIIHLSEEERITAVDFVKLSEKKVLPRIYDIWKENEFPESDTSIRLKNLEIGVNKYLT